MTTTIPPTCSPSRYKYELAKPMNWVEDYESTIKEAFPSLFEGENNEANITKLTMILSSPDGESQDCHVDSGW